LKNNRLRNSQQTFPQVINIFCGERRVQFRHPRKDQLPLAGACKIVLQRRYKHEKAGTVFSNHTPLDNASKRMFSVLSVQNPIQVSNQIFRVFPSHRKTHKGVANAPGLSLFASPITPSATQCRRKPPAENHENRSGADPSSLTVPRTPPPKGSVWQACQTFSAGQFQSPPAPGRQ